MNKVSAFFTKLFGNDVNEFETPFTVANAAKYGDAKTKASFFIMGFGEICNHQYIKGLMYLLIEIGYILYMLFEGIHQIAMLPGLGESEQGKVWNEALGVYEYTAGDNSVLILLFGIAAIFVSIGFIIIWKASVRGCYKSQWLREHGYPLPTFKQDVAALFDGEIQRTLLTLPVLGIVIFTKLCCDFAHFGC